MQIAIVGAGINGLYLSWKLSEMGHKTTVFERKALIGNNVCSGLFSERILDFIPQSKSLIKNRINYVLIHFPRKTIRVDFQKEFFVVDHAELDRMLAKETKAKIILNRYIKKIPQGFDRVIGADGPNSIVRKTLNLPAPKYRLGILGEARPRPQGRGRASPWASYNFVETWPVKQARLGQGFIWKIPRGENVEYGILAPQRIARKALFSFLEKNNIVLKSIKAKIVPQGFSLPNNGLVTLAGDAAGLTKPWSGGGVIWQLTLADILLKNFPDFKKYKKEAFLKLKPRVFLGKTCTNIIYFLGFNLPFFLSKKNKMESDFLIRK
ncbi:hypothetical protein AMJ47_04010 [Parcubacteria bacterium DG_72]|nr:MAG: hypothetical protein AMJ47_04010 [Parcubacteria bacterium DG_72]